ncbi:MAG: hypothetical protein JWQ02_3661 [Capsulimonas sp.]|nr:hypothetical protein [Capsulimonas sp.]
MVSALNLFEIFSYRKPALKLRNLYLTGLTALCIGSISAANAEIVISVEAPGVTSTTVGGTITETFNGYDAYSKDPLVSPIGTYTSGGVVNPYDQYGGAGETGKYLAVGAQSGGLDVTLTLAHRDAYFGMWFCAGDNQNELSFYDGGTLLGTMNTAVVLAKINENHAYFGKPVTGQDSGEPFAYLNFFGLSGTKFDKIVIHNDSFGTGFESDNHSVRAYQATLTGTEIPNGFNNVAPGAVPEPAAPVTFAFGALALGALMLRNRRRVGV